MDYIFHDKLSKLFSAALNSELKTPCLDKPKLEYSNHEISIIKAEAERAGIQNIAFPVDGKANLIAVSDL